MLSKVMLSSFLPPAAFLRAWKGFVVLEILSCGVGWRCGGGVVTVWWRCGGGVVVVWWDVRGG